MKNFKFSLEHELEEDEVIKRLKKIKQLNVWSFDLKQNEESSTKHDIFFLQEDYTQKNLLLIKVEVSSFVMDINIKIDERFIEIEGNSLLMVSDFSNAIQVAFANALNKLFVQKQKV